MSNGSADRDPLLLAARELARMRVPPVEETDTLQQLVRAPVPRRRRGTCKPELESHEPSRRQLTREGPPVVLVRVAERRGPVRSALS
jgi:hypothetical protein